MTESSGPGPEFEDITGLIDDLIASKPQNWTAAMELARLRKCEQTLIDLMYEAQIDGAPFHGGTSDTLDVLCDLNAHVKTQVGAKLAAQREELAAMLEKWAASRARDRSAYLDAARLVRRHTPFPGGEPEESQRP